MADNKALTGMAGVHFVASMLSQKGYAVAVTSGNTPRVDLLVANPDNDKTIAIQVKTSQNARYENKRKNERWRAWPVGKDPTKPIAGGPFWWAFVDLKHGKDMPDVYFLPSPIDAGKFLTVYRKAEDPEPRDVWLWIPESEKSTYQNNLGVIDAALH